MDQKPTKQEGEGGTLPQSSTGQVPADPRSLVLPNKQVHDPLNATRVNAGTLYTKEQTATLPKAPPPPPANFGSPTQSESVRPLETYQTDVEKYVRSQNVSTVTVAAAEEVRREVAGAPIALEPQPKNTIGTQLLLFVAGLAFVVLAIGGFAFAYLQTRPLPKQANPAAPFISVDSTEDVVFKAGDTRPTMMNVLVGTKAQTKLAVGLVAQLRPWIGSTTGNVTLTPHAFLSAFTPNIPPELARTLGPDMLIGVHSFDINQPLLLFSVDSYTGGYAGMLGWEKTLAHDLSPLFDYSPKNSNTEVSTTTEGELFGSPFTDLIVENHDARVIRNTNGDVVLLWTFLDRSTVLVTTNANTVHEVIVRLKSAPGIPSTRSPIAK